MKKRESFLYHAGNAVRNVTLNMRIPPAFVSRFSNDPDEHMVLEGPDGQKWDVQLWGSINQLEFRQGWKNYVDFHGLEMGDFLVFDYISKSYFKVKIYDRTACEKKLNARHFMNSNVDSPSDKVGSSSRRFWSIKMKSRNESFGQLCLLVGSNCLLSVLIIMF
ncbi:B3 domain-containing protein At3g18960-like [Cryptomeria japonica]|uniref:B3 domain-containing protein At3g18960-like n=1 Tax=Cryptomeria japonica TaxID=3369 RepID=UPI0027DA0FC7|nr:B3 domain-containing protein At3g18960-like [Cryptomeria japonica]